MASRSTPSILSVRVDPEERALLEAAAERSHTNLSDFVRRKALEAAEADVLDRTVVTIPAHDWEAFEAWAKRPSKVHPALEELRDLKPTWER
jgi:uncharacterized protein (DUF1778 family)